MKAMTNVANESAKLSPLSLLDLPYVFTQTPLLRPQEFEKEVEQRGVWPLRGHLETLHRADLLVPLYRLRKDVRALRAEARREGWRLESALIFEPSDPETMQDARASGNLRDPREEFFKPWSTYRKRTEGGLPYSASQFLYSWYQLLGVNRLQIALDHMRSYKTRTGKRRYRVRLNQRDFRYLMDRAPSDTTVIALCALDPWYKPRISRHLRGVPADQWQRAIEDFRPAEMLDWLGWDPAQLRRTAEDFLLSAESMDPLGDWHQLIRLGRPDKWRKLKGPALIAHDYRMAAEILLLFYEDLAKEGLAPQLEGPSRRSRHPLNHRLGADHTALDEVLTTFGLSPYPSLVLVLEGEVEMDIVPRVMRLLGIPQRRSFIALHNARGVDRDLGILASWVALPEFGEELSGRAVTFVRPVTRYMVTADPEGKNFGTTQARRQTKDRWVEELLVRVPEKYRTHEARRTLGQLVEITVWDRKGSCFEYAHFTDRQIARAILAVYGNDQAPSVGELGAHIASLRALGDPKFDRLWKSWPGRKPTKRKVAQALWPILERRVQRALQRDNFRSVPVMRVLVHAYELAAEFPRHSMVLEW